MTSIQPELWVETPGEAVPFYEAAFGATVLHRVGEGEDVVAQLGVGDAAFLAAATCTAGGSAGSSTHSATSGRSACLLEPGPRAKRRARIEGRATPTRPKQTT